MRIKNQPIAENIMAASSSHGSYSLALALADLIDNSITAKANLVDIRFLLGEDTARDLKVLITDDGKGMTSKELVDAMRPANRHVNDKISDGDLGRFGWGLKSASFSQATKLEVQSHKNNQTSIAIWDLADCSDWGMDLLEGTEAETLVDRYGRPDQKTWTRVIWHDCKRLTENYSLDQSAVSNLISDASDELGEIFHRFLEGESRKTALSIVLNGTKVIANDVFLKNKSELVTADPEILRIKNKLGESYRLKYKAYVLPHFSKLSQPERNLLGGREGLIKNQGFYLYRGNRLVVRGTWFGLQAFKPLDQLLRIQVDIPNHLDEIFKLTIDKSNANLPDEAKRYLKEIIQKTVIHSRRRIGGIGKRPKVQTSEKFDAVWVLERKAGKVRFALNRRNPLLTEWIDNPDFLETMLSMIESSLPIDLIRQQLQPSLDNICQPPSDHDGLVVLARAVVNSLKSSSPDVTTKELRDKISSFDFFRNTPQLIDEVLKDLDTSGVKL